MPSWWCRIASAAVLVTLMLHEHRCCSVWHTVYYTDLTPVLGISQFVTSVAHKVH